MAHSELTAKTGELLRAMTLEEKLGQLTMIRIDAESAGTLPAEQLTAIREGRAGSVLDLKGPDAIREVQKIALTETRLGIPLLFALDVLHGYETVFPIPLAEAAAMDPPLWHATARAAAREAAANGIALTFAPMLDVSRDPRWGRMAEGPGEDPWLASRFAEAKVRGFQGEDARSGIAATAKHFVGYGAVTAGREYGSIDISNRTLHEVYLPPFLAAVRVGAAAIMPALSDFAGLPLTAHPGLLRDLLRKRWGFEGVVISDFHAIAELITHGVAAGIAEAAALALKAGVDIDMASGAYLDGLPEALARGLVLEADIDLAVKRVLALKARLGLFDQAADSEGYSLPGEVSAEHRALAREAARKSIVLLKNRDRLLPLPKAPRRLAVAGPLADAPGEMLGPWHCAGKAEGTVSFLQGLRAALPDWELSYFGNAISGGGETIRKADLFLLCLGETANMCGEAASRARPQLPDFQRKLFEDVSALGKPVIVVLTSGRPLIDSATFEAADAVLAAWFPGSEAGTALADILTGAVNPSGKLPVSWPAEVGQIPIFFSQRRTGRPADPAIHNTSKYIDVPVEPLFPFGHGLSFTEFAYRNLRVSPGILQPGGRIAVELDIENVGALEGEETCLLFIRDAAASIARPVLELRGMAKIKLAAGAAGSVAFELTAEDLSFPADDGSLCLEPGCFEILAGPCADPEKLLCSTIHVP